MGNNKLYSEIEKNIDEASWFENGFANKNTFEDNKYSFQEINSRIAAEKLYQLIEDVSVEFEHWLRNLPLQDRAIVVKKFKGIAELDHKVGWYYYQYFIENIYKP